MQQELFDSGASPQRTAIRRKSNFLERFRISLRFDHALLVGILFIILFVVFFSFGVENGKRFATAELKAERQKRADMVDELRRQILALQKRVVSEARSQVAPRAPEQPAIPSVVAVEPVPQAVKSIQEVEVPRVVEPQKPDGKYTIQTVTYKSESDANRQIEKYKKLGLSSFVIPSGAYIQVCVNAFESKQKAIKELRQMKTEGLIPSDAYVRAIPH